MIPKFRAWDKKVKEMIEDVASIHFKTEMITTSNLYFYPFKDIELMQSTGLKDKNGMEIFEGDILHHPLQGMRKVYYPFVDTVASYGLENIENGMRSTLQDTHRVYEVVGNIHEHPELLIQPKQ